MNRHGYRLAGFLAVWAGLCGAPVRAQAPFPAPAAPAAAPARAEARRLAGAAMRDGLYDMAEKYFRAAATAAANDAERAQDVLELSNVLTLAGRPVEALRELNGVTAGGDALLAQAVDVERARAHLAAGQADQALAVVTARSGDAGADVPELGRLKGLALMALNRPAEALKAFQALLALGPRETTPQDLLDAAVAAEQAGDAAAAAVLLNRVVAEYPAHPLRREADLRWAALAAGTTAKPEEVSARLQSITSDGKAPAADRARAWLALAASYERAQAVPRALEAVEQALAADPDPARQQETRLVQARLWVRAGDWERGRHALRALVPAMAAHPRAARAQLELARYLQLHRHAAEALEEFQRYLDVFDLKADRAEVHLGKAWALMELGRATEAAETFDRAIELVEDPAARVQARVKAADAWFAAGQFAQALDRYEAIATQAPAYEPMADIELQIAACLRSLGRAAEAEKKYDAIAVTRAGTAAAARARLGQASLAEEAGRWADALARYSEVVGGRTEGADPLRLRARLGRGLVLSRQGDWAGARTDFEAAAAAPEGPEVEALRDQAHFLLTWALDQTGRHEDAVRGAKEFLRGRPKSSVAPRMQFWLAEQAFNGGRYEEAEQGFAGVATAFPESTLVEHAWFWAGRAALAGREFLRANEHMNQLARTRPKSELLAAARFTQGDALTELGQFDAAILAFDEIIQQQGDRLAAARAWGRKGDCHFTLGAGQPRRYEEAVQCYETAAGHTAADDEVRVQAWYKAGRARERMNAEEEALDRYQRAVFEHLDAREKGRAGAELWFARAVFGAADLHEKRGRKAEAAALLQRLAESGAAAAAEARARLRRLAAVETPPGAKP